MKTTTYDETKWKLAPVEPAPEQIAAASVAAWPAASEKDMQMAKAAARIVLTKHMEAAPGASLDSIAAAMATMFPAYRSMLAAAPDPPTQPVVSDAFVKLCIYERRHGTFATLGSQVLFGAVTSPTGQPTRTYEIPLDDLREIIQHAERTGEPE